MYIHICTTWWHMISPPTVSEKSTIHSCNSTSMICRSQKTGSQSSMIPRTVLDPGFFFPWFPRISPRNPGFFPGFSQVSGPILPRFFSRQACDYLDLVQALMDGAKAGDRRGVGRWGEENYKNCDIELVIWIYDVWCMTYIYIYMYVCTYTLFDGYMI